MAKTVTFLGCPARAMPRTKKHRPAVWEAMLGTVYALNDERRVQYFDYDWDAAFKFAGVSQDRDPRVHRVRREDNYNWIRHGSQYDNPGLGKMVLWITKKEVK